MASILSRHYPQICKKCTCCVENVVVHLMLVCHKNEANQVKLWEALVDSCSLCAFTEITRFPLGEQCARIFKLATENDGERLINYRVAFTLKHALTC